MKAIIVVIALLLAISFVAGGFAGRAIERHNIAQGMEKNNQTFCPVTSCYVEEIEKRTEWINISVDHILRDAK